MQIHDLAQGSPEWQHYRLQKFGASEAAAMLGISSRVSRTELLHMKATGTAQEFSDWVQKNILDYGHEVEALARPLVEQLIGTDLYPVTCSDGLLSASCDGLTMAEDVAFEHKQWNQALAEAVAAGELPDEYMPQCQQILMVTGASKVVFVCSDGTLDNFVYLEVLPDPAWQERIRAGWEQFEKDLATYEPKQYAPKPEAEPIMSLPALVIQIRGEVATSNLPAFQARAERFIASIKTDLVTDQDFADAEATVKFCEKAEGDLEQAKRAALEQTADIAELMRTIDHISEQLRAKRLTLARTVKDKKELIKASILAQVKQAFADHVAALEREIAPLRLVFQARDFAGAMKNKRTLATLQDAVDTELANAKIAADAIAAAARGRLAWYREHAAGYEFLFADLQTVIQKGDEDFQLVVNTRIQNHKRIEAEKAERARQEQEAARERAEAEGRRRAEAEARAREEAIARAQARPAEATHVQTEPQNIPEIIPDPAPAAAAVTPIAAARPAAAGTPPTLRLGQINERLAPISLTADGLAALGFTAAGRERAAVLYHEADFPRICAALIRHVTAVAQAKAA
jgi:predicted phage-related endonuclease